MSPLPFKLAERESGLLRISAERGDAQTVILKAVSNRFTLKIDLLNREAEELAATLRSAAREGTAA